jgi:hypothetical protein
MVEDVEMKEGLSQVRRAGYFCRMMKVVSLVGWSDGGRCRDEGRSGEGVLVLVLYTENKTAN